MSKLFLKKYQNKNSKLDKAYGKWYLRARHLDTIGTRELCRHMLRFGTIYTEDVVLGVISKLSQFIIDMSQQGYKIKLDGLGTFYLAVTSEGSETEKDCDENGVKYKHLRFTPEQSQWSDTATRNMTVAARVTTVDPYADPEEEDNEETGNSGGTNGGSGSGNGGGTTTGGDEPGEDRP